MAKMPKVHKETNGATWCGYPALKENKRRFWRLVTCKNCLKMRPQ